MLKFDQLAAICRIPEVFYTSGASFVDAVRASGYVELRPKLSAADLTAYLDRHPELIGRWLVYSSDKRVPEGWYLLDRPVWSVGRLGGAEKACVPERRFESSAEACAVFILHELDDITQGGRAQ